MESRHDFVVRPTVGDFFVEEVGITTATRCDLGVVAVGEVEREIGAVEPGRTRLGSVPERDTVQRCEPGGLRWHPCVDDALGQVEAWTNVDVTGFT